MSEAPTIESFEMVKLGHRVRFLPRDSIGGAQGLRKPIVGRVRNIDKQRGTAQIGDWIVPLKKIQRLQGDVYRSWSKVARKAEHKAIYGDLKPPEKKQLLNCAKDARQAFLTTSSYTGPLNKSFLSEIKRTRQSYMRRHGIEDFTDRGQCEALPKFLERALAAGQVPQLRGIEYASADNGTVGVGDVLTIGGKPFKMAGFTKDGAVILKDGYEIIVPADLLPKDKGSPIRSGLEKLEVKRKERLKRWRKKKQWCFCYGRDAAGRFESLKRAANPGLHRRRLRRCLHRMRRARFHRPPQKAFRLILWALLGAALFVGWSEYRNGKGTLE